MNQRRGRSRKTERGQFTFYASFASALRRLRNPAERCTAYDAIIDYALSGREPELDELPDAVAIAFELIRPNLDSSRRKAESGQKGGLAGSEADKKQTGSRAKAKRGLIASKKENENEKENEIENENESENENECSLPPLARREGESFDEYLDRLRTLRESGALGENKGFLHPKGSVKTNGKEGTAHEIDSG